MGRTLSRLAAVAATVILFGLLWIVIARNPWAPKRSAEPDPALTALAAKRDRLQRRAILVGKTVKRRWTVYERALVARRREIASVRAKHASELRAARAAAARIAAVQAAAADAAKGRAARPAAGSSNVAVSASPTITAAPVRAASPSPAAAVAPAPTSAPAAPPPPPVQVTSAAPVTTSSSSGTAH